MAIVFKGFFRNKNHWQQKINNLERLESRRWDKHIQWALDKGKQIMAADLFETFG